MHSLLYHIAIESRQMQTHWQGKRTRPLPNCCLHACLQHGRQWLEAKATMVKLSKCTIYKAAGAREGEKESERDVGEGDFRSDGIVAQQLNRPFPSHPPLHKTLSSPSI